MLARLSHNFASDYIIVLCNYRTAPPIYKIRFHELKFDAPSSQAELDSFEVNIPILTVKSEVREVDIYLVAFQTFKRLH